MINYTKELDELKNIISTTKLELFPMEYTDKELDENTRKLTVAWAYHGMGYYHTIVYHYTDTNYLVPNEKRYSYMIQGGSSGFARDITKREYENTTYEQCRDNQQLMTFDEAVTEMHNN